MRDGNSDSQDGRMPLAEYGKYLGFFVGPGQGEHSWDEPGKKYTQRCRDWGDQGIGLQYHTVAYNTFAVSTLGYIGQVEQVPAGIVDLEEDGLKITHKGTRDWASPADMRRLRESYGQSASCRSIRLASQASQLRVRAWDPACRARHYAQDVRALREALSRPRQLSNRARWDDW